MRLDRLPLFDAPPFSQLTCNPRQNAAGVINRKPSLMSAAQLGRPCAFLFVLVLHTDLFIHETAVAHKLGQLLDSDMAPSITPLRRQWSGEKERFPEYPDGPTQREESEQKGPV